IFPSMSRLPSATTLFPYTTLFRSVTFSEAIDPRTVTGSSFVVVNQATNSPIAGTVTPHLFDACLVPTGGLQPSQAYTATVKGGGSEEHNSEAESRRDIVYPLLFEN